MSVRLRPVTKMYSTGYSIPPSQNSLSLPIPTQFPMPKTTESHEYTHILYFCCLKRLTRSTPCLPPASTAPPATPRPLLGSSPQTFDAPVSLTRIHRSQTPWAVPAVPESHLHSNRQMGCACSLRLACCRYPYSHIHLHPHAHSRPRCSDAVGSPYVTPAARDCLPRHERHSSCTPQR
jgi:hypothetical protein